MVWDVTTWKGKMGAKIVFFLSLGVIFLSIGWGLHVPSVYSSSYLHMAHKNVLGRAASMTAVPASLLLASPLAVHASEFSSAVAARPVLDIFVNVMSLLFICRIVMSWYPKTDTSVFPYNAITWPTEPLLAPARKVLPPAFGVDISAIVWVMLLSFVREVFTGQQGILTLLEKGM